MKYYHNVELYTLIYVSYIFHVLYVLYMGQIFVEGDSFKKIVIFFLILKAHYSFVFHSRGTDLAFPGLPWHGYPNDIKHHVYFLFHSPL